jgi:hypothetical protein
MKPILLLSCICLFAALSLAATPLPAAPAATPAVCAPAAPLATALGLAPAAPAVQPAAFQPRPEPAATCCTSQLILICQREGLRCGFDEFGNCGCQLHGPH